jgi:hypothetical protein
MNPFDENRTAHNTWLVILMMYNLQTWLCHKRKYIMLSILIQGLKQAGINIDVFLEPLMKDMKKLWNEGCIYGTSINRSISRCMQSYSFASITYLSRSNYFFQAPSYWKDLQTCHSIDLMNVTKNIFNSIIGTLLDILRKTKDRLKSRTDLVQFQLRPELHLILRPNGKHFLPPASYTLTVEEKKTFCQCLCGGESTNRLLIQHQ